MQAPSAATGTPDLLAATPTPPSERGPWAIACALAALGVAVLVAVLSGAVGRTSAVSPPAIALVAPTPVPGMVDAAAVSAGERSAAIVTQRPAAQQRADAARFIRGGEAHVARRWMEGFYPIYAAAQRAFGVNWLLIASIHMQETAFSTDPTTYHGLNFARCCGGPMQFNVTNGPVTTWDLVRDSYRYGPRPASYDHRTATHPSIYDDFDSIMAAAHLLSADGAGYGLDGSAWGAAYDYYGHDGTGVLYADEVLARAIGWSQHGFCIDCAVSPSLQQAVDAAYGAPARAELEAPKPAPRATAARVAARPRIGS
jgi:hypothetical protein